VPSTVDGIVTTPIGVPVNPVIIPELCKKVINASTIGAISGEVVIVTLLFSVNTRVCRLTGVIVGPTTFAAIILLEDLPPSPLLILPIKPSLNACSCIIRFE